MTGPLHVSTQRDFHGFHQFHFHFDVQVRS
jgi:hypothetical protein